MLTSQEISLAHGIAVGAHAGQLDKIKAPYIEHPEMVASLVQLLPDFTAADPSTQEAAVCAAWLYDVIEDTPVTADELAAAGLSPEVVAAVVALTRTPDVQPDDYYAAIRVQPVAKLVKTADLASNLAPERVAQLDTATRERLAKRYSHALEELRVDRSVITALHEAASAQPTPPGTTGGGASIPL